MAVNLTTIARVKQFLGLDQSDSDKDDLIEFIIDGVSRQIAEHCDRTFEATTYKQWIDGNGSRRIRLPQYPVTRLYGVAVSSQTVGTIQYTGSGKIASAELSSSRLSLMHVTSSGVDTATDITTAGMTVSELSTSVNAQTGWSFSIASGKDNYAATQVRPFASGDVVSPADYDLEHPDNYEHARIVSETDGAIELDQGCFYDGRSNVFTWYKAGYTLPTEGDLTSGNVPKGLELVVNMIVKDIFSGASNDTGLKSEKIGDYSYTLNDGVFTEAVMRYKDELWPWVRKGI